MKKYYIAVIIPFLFSNFLSCFPDSFYPQHFENLDVTKPENLAHVVQMLNVQETLLKDNGLFNPDLNNTVNGYSGNYKVYELENNNENSAGKKYSITEILGHSASTTDLNDKTVYTYQYNSYQAEEGYPAVSGNFYGVKDTKKNEIHLKGSVQIKLSGGNKTLHLDLGNSSGREPLDSVVIDKNNKVTGGKISLSFDNGVQSEYNLSKISQENKAMINKLGFLNV